MYTFTIKENGPDINVVVTRSLLALAGIASLLYRNNQYYYINIIAAIILIVAAVLVNVLFVQFKVNKLLLLSIAALILFIATRSIPFAAMLVVFGMLVKKFYKTPVVVVNTQGVNVQKMFSNQVHPWSRFNNIILKDNLLTLDFKNNQLWQLTIIESDASVDEHSFNTFCSGFVGV
jgi:hypothetical protein